MKNFAEENVLVFECINFKNGTGTKKPLNIGYFEVGQTGKKTQVYFHFWIEKMTDDSPRKIEYTIFSEEN